MYRLSPVSRIILVVGCLALVLLIREPLAAQTTPVPYYYYQGARVPLQINPRLVAVRFDAGVSTQARRAALAASVDVDRPAAAVDSPVSGLVFVPLRAGADVVGALARLKTSAGVLFVSPVYQFESMQLAETDEFLVRFKPELGAGEIAAINLAKGVTFSRSMPFSDQVLILKPAPDNSRPARELANDYVEAGWAQFAEPNFVIRTPPLSPTLAPHAGESSPAMPNDPNFGSQWSLRNTRQFQGSITGDDINAVNAWSVTQGASSLRIAILDEGVDDTHPDLSGQLAVGYNAIDGSSDTSPQPNDYHGTAAAGVAAAATNNALGIAGVCWFCRILPVKIAERDAQGNWQTTTAILAAGIDWAWQNGADVLNGSWTMPAPSDAVQLSIINARLSGRGGKGSTLVFAAGNDNLNSVAFPARLNAYVIAVGASNWCDERKTPTNNGCNNGDASWGSNYGNPLDLVAPGEALLTTCNGNQCQSNGYTYFVGTSAATPLVAGAAALLYSLNPNLTPDQVQTALEAGAKDLGTPGKDAETGYGRLDAYRAIFNLYGLRLSVNGSQPLVRPGDTVTYSIDYSNDGMTAMGSTVISVTLPAGTSYLSSTPAFAPQGGGVYQLNLGTLASNATGAASFRLKPDPASAGVRLTFNAAISGAFPEANPTDNFASATTLVSKQDYFLPLLRYNRKP